MLVITFGSLKGGTGKSSLALLTARRIASTGRKVLVVDFDINDSTSFTLTPHDKIQELDPGNRKHLAAALQGEKLTDYIIPSSYTNIDLIRSSLYLVDLRTISINRFKNLLKTIPEDLYDYVIVDTAPTYDNLVLNAYEASNIIITPVLLNQFDFNTANFLCNKLRIETSVEENWKLLVNQWNYYCDNPNSDEHDYIDLFNTYFSDKLLKSHINSTRLIKSLIDRNSQMTTALKFEKLRQNIDSFVSEITGIDFSENKEIF